MPVVTLNRKELEKLTGKKLPEAKLKDRISMLGTDLDSMKKDEIMVEVFPDRPDMLSEQGFARALSTFIGAKKGLAKFRMDSSNTKEYKVIIDRSVESVRPYTVCAIVKKLSFTDEKIREIIQIQEKLHITYGRNRKKLAIGIYPMEHIKLPIHYKALSPDEIRFVPLESEKEMTGRQILSSHPTGKEYAHLLKGKKKYPVFVDDKGDILSMPPIINSSLTGKVTEKTKEVFIEFSGHDIDVQMKGLNMIVTALHDMGGKLYAMELQYPDKKMITPDLEPWSMKLSCDYVNKILGLDLKSKEISAFLQQMGYGTKAGNSVIEVLVPSYRADILHPIDLVEDISIAYGYENLEPEIPNVATTGQEDALEKFKAKVAEIMAGLGMLEIVAYSISDENKLNRKMENKMPFIPLKNALTEEYSVLRNWLMPDLMGVLEENKHHDYPQNIFEIGDVFLPGEGETGVEQRSRLAAAVCHPRADYTQIKQHLDVLIKSLGLEARYEEADNPSFIKGRCARVRVGKKKVAYIGEISPKVLQNFQLEMPVSAFELNLTELFDLI